jgi:hypothetical protein
MGNGKCVCSPKQVLEWGTDRQDFSTFSSPRIRPDLAGGLILARSGAFDPIQEGIDSVESTSTG